MSVILETDLDLPLFRRGKVRDCYDLGDRLLLVATDRISAFDSVLPTGIPWKGAVLTGLSVFWFRFLSGVVRHHLLGDDVRGLGLKGRTPVHELEGRTMLVKKTRPVPFECVVRGYLAGSGWDEYSQTGSVTGIPLPKGLARGGRLPEPIFTPATKAAKGHDINITERQMAEAFGVEKTRLLKEKSLEIYNRAHAYAAERGILIADTKFEWGEDEEGLILIDEVLTPDSSRFWPNDDYRPGREQPSFDKQYVRDYLNAIRWNREPPAPPLPSETVAKTSEKYLEAYRRLTGREMAQMGKGKT